MNKADLGRDVAGCLGVECKQAAAALGAVLEAVADGGVKGEKTGLAGIGTSSGSTDARSAHNPATGESIDVAATKAVKFKPATAAGHRRWSGLSTSIGALRFSAPSEVST